MNNYKVIGSGFIFKKDEDIFNFVQKIGDWRKLGLEGLEQEWNIFKKENETNIFRLD